MTGKLSQRRRMTEAQQAEDYELFDDTPNDRHGQLCPIWTRRPERRRKSEAVPVWTECDCRQLRRVRHLADIVLGTPALRDVLPTSGEHALHYDPDCEECVYLARPVAVRIPTQDPLRAKDISMAEHSDTRSACPSCGEWRDSPTADCAGCGYDPTDDRTPDQIADDLDAMAPGNFA